MVIQELTADIDRIKVIRKQGKENKKERKKNIMSSCSEVYYPRLRTTVMLSYTFTYTSAVRFPERYLPHDTIIPDHDKPQTSPKMTTISPPQIPW
jgi:hypothetical protein